MGWFGCGALDSDDGFDLQDELFDFIGVKYDGKYTLIQSDEEIKNLLQINQDKIYDWMRDYDWSKKYNPDFIQEVYIQGLMQIFLNYGVPISDRGVKDAIPFIENDQWAKTDKNRKIEMDILKDAVLKSNQCKEDINVPKILVVGAGFLQ